MGNSIRMVAKCGLFHLIPLAMVLSAGCLAPAAMARSPMAELAKSVLPLKKMKAKSTEIAPPKDFAILFDNPQIAGLSKIYTVDRQPLPRKNSAFTMPFASRIQFDVDIEFRKVVERYAVSFETGNRKSVYIFGSMSIADDQRIFCSDRNVRKIGALDPLSKLLVSLVVQKGRLCTSPANRDAIEGYIQAGRRDFLRENSHLQLKLRQ